MWPENKSGWRKSSQQWKFEKSMNKDLYLYFYFARKLNVSNLCDLTLPEHLNSWSWRSAMFCPLRWLGEWHLVYWAKRGECRRYLANQDNWQSQWRRFSLRRNVRNRNMLLNISLPSHVKLLLFNVLGSELTFEKTVSVCGGEKKTRRSLLYLTRFNFSRW